MAANTWIAVAAIGGFGGVALGAFGAHALRDRLAVFGRDAWTTATQYQFVHVLALLAVGVLLARQDARLLQWSAWAFAVGTLLFSGSLYAMALTGLRPLGAITPLGGLVLLAGWCLLAAWALRA